MDISEYCRHEGIIIDLHEEQGLFGKLFEVDLRPDPWRYPETYVSTEVSSARPYLLMSEFPINELTPADLPRWEVPRVDGDSPSECLLKLTRVLVGRCLSVAGTCPGGAYKPGVAYDSQCTPVKIIRHLEPVSLGRPVEDLSLPIKSQLPGLTANLSTLVSRCQVYDTAI